MVAMVLERKTLPKSLSSYFAAPRIAAIPRDGGLFLTTALESDATLAPVNKDDMSFWAMFDKMAAESVNEELRMEDFPRMTFGRESVNFSARWNFD